MIADNLQQLLESSAYVFNGEIMPSPKAIFTQVLETLEDLDADMKNIRVFAQDDSGTADPDKKNTRDIAFGKAMIEVIFPYEYMHDSDLCLRVAYNLKRKKPQYFVFIGYRDRTNNNLVVWDHSQCRIFYDFATLSDTIKSLKAYKWSIGYDSLIQSLQSSVLSQEQIDQSIGFLLKESRFGRYGSSVVTSLVKNLQDRNGIHYLPTEDSCDLYKLLRASGIYLGKSRNFTANPMKTLNFVSNLVLCKPAY